MTIPLLFGPYGRDALENAERFADVGANAAWFHGFDATAFERCERAGIAACVEFPTFRADFDLHPELVPIGVDGKPIRYGELVQGICLSQTEFLAQREVELLAGLRAHRPVGVWLDYLTYAGWFEMPDPDLQQSCFCAGCVADFNEKTGIDAQDPQEILTRHLDRWTQHKCGRIASFGELYADMIRSHLPGCVVGAYMCPWTPDEFDGALTRIFAQDYYRLAASIDVFSPLIYGTKSGRPDTWGREFLEAAPAFVPQPNKVQLIVDALDGAASIEAIGASAEPSWGLQVFSGAQLFEDAALGATFRQTVDGIRAVSG